MNNYCDDYDDYGLDAYDRQQIMMEGEQEKAFEEAQEMAPEHCKDCDDLSFRREDNTFSAPARYEGDHTRFGSVDVVPYCEELEDVCPECEENCPYCQKENGTAVNSPEFKKVS